ncbi:major capsid protein [Microvirus mar35]|uniref:Major capsid protein n=1 Tax=Microvirus mar35 TaxID=2851169 RepID=A0A8F5MKN8_9VIRU|nr:major capsid protein [Microvirus mar35]
MASLMEVMVKKPNTSNFDLSKNISMSANTGPLYPVYQHYCVPGEFVSINYDALIRTNPAFAPLYGRYKVKIDTFFCPYRLYNPSYRLNDDDFDVYGTLHPLIRLPQVGTGQSTLTVNFQTPSVYPGSVLNYLGLPPFYFDRSAAGNYCEFNAYAYAAYVDIYRNYYVDPQRTYGVVMGVTRGDIDNNFRRPYVINYPMDSLNDVVRSFSEAQPGSPAVLDFNESFMAGYDAGLFLRTYQPDIFTANLNPIALSELYTTNGVRVSDNVFTWQQARMSSKLTRLAELTQVFGGRFSDWLSGVFGITSKKNLDIPQYLGSSTMYFSFSEETVSATTSQATTGAPVGKGFSSSNSFRPIKFKATEYGVLMTILSICPIPHYIQGVNPFLLKKKASDDYNPILDNIGFQDLPLAYLYASYNGDYTKRAPGASPITLNVWTGVSGQFADPFKVVLGSVPAWTEYCTAWDTAYGCVASVHDRIYWTLARQFSPSVAPANLTASSYGLRSLPAFNSMNDFDSYVRPNYWQYPFSVQDTNAQNWFVRLSLSVKATLPKSKNVMPTLN